MNDYFQANRRSLFILVGLLLFLAIVLYFILLRPLHTDLNRQESRVASIKADIDLLESKLDSVEDKEIDVDQLKYERVVPRKPNIDDYILSLQQLELTTKTKIMNINFTYDSNLDMPEVESRSEDEDSGITVDQLDEEDLNIEGRDDTSVAIDQDLLEEKPDTLQVIIVNMSAMSADYDSFLDVLKAIENNERISVISSLSFTKPTEEDIYFSDIPLDWIPFEIELTTFYYDD